jgi:hypothetical protein
MIDLLVERGHVTASVAANLLGVTRQRVNQLLKAGALNGAFLIDVGDDREMWCIPQICFVLPSNKEKEMKTLTIEKDWTTESGLRAVVMLTKMGHRCGYVGIGTDHPLFGVAYNEQHPLLKLNMDRSVEKMGAMQMLCAAAKPVEELNTPEMVFEVHGGLTFSSYGSGTYPVESNLWWYGYDCAHAGDLPEPNSEMGRMYANMGFAERDGVIRTHDYCVAECESLATQLAGVKQ